MLGMMTRQAETADSHNPTMNASSRMKPFWHEVKLRRWALQYPGWLRLLPPLAGFVAWLIQDYPIRPSIAILIRFFHPLSSNLSDWRCRTSPKLAFSARSMWSLCSSSSEVHPLPAWAALCSRPKFLTSSLLLSCLSPFASSSGFAYVSIKMLEAFSPSALSEQDKLDSSTSFWTFPPLLSCYL